MATNNSDINQQASPHNIPQSSIYSHFTEQARRAGYTGLELGRTQQHFHPYPYSLPISHPLSLSNTQPHSLPLSHPRSFPPPHSHEMHEAMHREIEKQLIREDIIMSEIVRRRVLEAEVRKEIMMERELALQSGGNGTPFGSSSVIGFESPTRLPLLGTGAEGRSLTERIIPSLTEKERLNRRRDNGGFETLPFVRGSDLRISEVKPVSEAGKEKGKIILLAKPDEDISASKRKAVIPPAGPDSSEPQSDGVGILRKKVKEEWSCSVCQVSTTSEHALNEHLHGKKHKSKEAALRAQRAGKNYSIGLFPKIASESPPLLMENLNSPGISKNNQSVVTQNLNPDNSKKNESVVVPEAQEKDDSKKNRYRWWCELCQVGSHSRKIMNFHKRGKKHSRQLEASKQNATIIVLNRKWMDEDGENFDGGLEEDHEPDVADEPKDGELTVS